MSSGRMYLLVKMCIYGCLLWLQLPSPLLIEDIDLLEDEHTHSPALSSVDSTGDGSKVRADIPFVYERSLLVHE